MRNSVLKNKVDKSSWKLIYGVHEGNIKSLVQKVIECHDLDGCVKALDTCLKDAKKNGKIIFFAKAKNKTVTHILLSQRS